MSKAQATIVFSVESTEYGWSVREANKQLGLFMSQRQALDDVRKRRAVLKKQGLSSSVTVISKETEEARNLSRRTVSRDG